MAKSRKTAKKDRPRKAKDRKTAKKQQRHTGQPGPGMGWACGFCPQRFSEHYELRAHRSYCLRLRCR